MKSHKKSTKMMQRALSVVAISLALLLFSVLGVVALLTTAHANSLGTSIASDTPGVTPSASADATPTQTTPTPTPTQPPTPTPVPTKAPTKTPPTSTPTSPPNNPTPVPTATSATVPVVGVTPTAAAMGPGGTQITPTPRKGKPTPTPSPSPTNTPANSVQGTTSTATPAGHTPGTTTGNTSHNGGMTPLTASLAGAGAFLMLSTTGLVGLVVWRRRKATLTQTAGAQAPGALAAQNHWPVPPVAPAANYHSQPTEFSVAAPAANAAMIPFALQGFSQYSPLLGAPNASHMDAPTPIPSSDFHPLQLDFPQIIGQNDAAPVHTPLPTQQVSPADLGTSFPQPPPSTPARSEPARVDLQPTLPGNPSEQPELQSDPFLESMIQRVQMGIFALPGKDS